MEIESEQPNYYAILPANVRYDVRLKPNEKLLYGEITALSNKTGVCYATNSYFANLYHVSKETVSRWLTHLKKIGYIDIELIFKNTQEIDKRVIKIGGTPVERSASTYIPENEVGYCSNNQEGYCLKSQGGIDKKVKENNTSINNKIYIVEFEELWKLYPNKQGKTKAQDYYIRSRKKGVTKEQVEKGIMNYLKYIEKHDWYSPKNGSTWFNQECWNDDYDVGSKVEETTEIKYEYVN